jgi:hypothetical protein
MTDNNKTIETYCVIGELDNEPIHYKEGLRRSKIW